MKRYLKRRFAGLRIGLIAVLLAGAEATNMRAETLPDDTLPVVPAEIEASLPSEPEEMGIPEMGIPEISPAEIEDVQPEVSKVPTPRQNLTPIPVEEPPLPQEVPLAAVGDGMQEIIQERYANGAVKTERGVRQDAEGNYVLDGDWRSFDQKGVLIAEGQYQHNQRHGIWRRFLRGDEVELLKTTPYSEFRGPFISQVTFQKGKMHGAWIITDSKQRKVSEIEFANGERNGTSRWWHASGHLAHELSFQNGQIHGEARIWDTNGALLRKENYLLGRRAGSQVDKYESGQKKQQVDYLFAPLVAKSKDDWWHAKLADFEAVGKEERHGHFAAWHPNGLKQRQGEYEHGLPVGKMTWWHPNGQKSVEGLYQQGKPIGQWNWWHENGQKSIAGEFNDGQPTGQWQWWKADGRLTQKVDMSKGKDIALTPQKKQGIPAVEGTEGSTSRRSR